MNFWDVHGGWFIFFMLLFPRLTMLCTGICTMGLAHPVLFWLGWIFTPRLVVAILATSFYWNTNPVLCVLAWIYAICAGSASTKKTKDVTQNRVRNRRTRPRRQDGHLVIDTECREIR